MQGKSCPQEVQVGNGVPRIHVLAYTPQAELLFTAEKPAALGSGDPEVVGLVARLDVRGHLDGVLDPPPAWYPRV